MSDTLQRILSDRFRSAFQEAVGEGIDPAVRESQVADYQADASLRLGKRLGRPPRDIAAAVVAKVRLGDICKTVTVSGPGFINVELKESTIEERVVTALTDGHLGVALAEPTTIVVDYSAPNVAKEMHVGHLRSTIIGDATSRLLEWLGHDVIRQNHIGDWGTPFGMLIEHLFDVAGEVDEWGSIEDLDGLYKEARVRFDSDPEFKHRSRFRVVQLQGGDEASLAAWRRVVSQSQSYFMEIYDRLGVTLKEADFVGESSYHEELTEVLSELDHLRLLRESGGAICAFPAGFEGRDGEPLPLIVRKSDGGFGYAATDLAALRRRTRDLRASRLLYVVGQPQSQHLEMVFALGREAGWLEGAVVEHVAFGSVLGEDGRMLRSRSGEAIRLAELLDEAVRRARAMLDEKSTDLPADDRQELAEMIGIGAVKYADLSTDRSRNYVFDYSRMLSLEGDTAPYLQYAVARVESLLRKSGEPIYPESVRVQEEAERRLALALARFPEVVYSVAESIEFHRLTTYLYGVATSFSSFYEQCPVLRAEPEVRAGRLALCAATARTLSAGLAILGIGVPRRL